MPAAVWLADIWTASNEPVTWLNGGDTLVCQDNKKYGGKFELRSDVEWLSSASVHKEHGLASDTLQAISIRILNLNIELSYV